MSEAADKKREELDLELQEWLESLDYILEERTPEEVRNLLCENADDLGDPGFDVYFGCESAAGRPGLASCNTRNSGNGIAAVAEL